MSPTRSACRLDKYRFSPVGTLAVEVNRRVPPQLSEDVEDTAVSSLKVEDERAIDSSDAHNGIVYPYVETQRRSFRTKAGKAVTEHQWAVYDFVRKVPAGKVTTYKAICSALASGSPRSVGTALRNNPFAPFVPCHRVIASTGYIGGFLGEWNNAASVALNPGQGQGKNVRRKIEILRKEGVTFDNKGYLIGGEDMIWVGN